MHVSATTRQPIRQPVRRATMLVALAGSLLVLLLAPVRAWAHAELIESNPPDGAELTAVPATVTLTFSEEITGPAQVAVTAPNGTQVQDGEAATSGDTVTQQISPQGDAESAGSWTVAYRVVSIDGHTVTGEFPFTVDGEGQSTRANDSQVGEGEPPPAGESGAAAPSTGDPGGPEDSSSWYGRTSWRVVGIGALLVAVLAWALRRHRHA